MFNTKTNIHIQFSSVQCIYLYIVGLSQSLLYIKYQNMTLFDSFTCTFKVLNVKALEPRHHYIHIKLEIKWILG